MKIPTRAELLAVFDRATKDAGDGVHGEPLDRRAARERRPRPGKIVSVEGDSDGERHRVEAVERRARAREADRLQGRRSAVQRVRARADRRSRRTRTYMSAAFASQIMATQRPRAVQPHRSSEEARGQGRVGRRDRSARRAKVSSGRASPKDLETMFQLDLSELHRAAARHGGVRGVQEAGRLRISRTAAPIRTRCSATPCQVTMSQHNLRARPLTRGDVRRGRIRRRRSRSTRTASPTRAISRSSFVGNVDTVTLKPLVEKYLASLPSTRPQGDVPRQRRSVRRRASSRRWCARASSRRRTRSSSSPGACEYAPQTRFAIRALSELVADQAERNAARAARRHVQPERRRRVRPRVPRQEYSITVQFNSSPENVEKLTKSVFALIDSLKTHGPSRGRRREGEGAAHSRARGGDQAERVLARQHHGARSGRRGHRRAARRRMTRWSRT